MTSNGASVSKLQTDTAAARKAADAAVEKGKPKEEQRELAVKACALEEQLRFAEWKQLQEDAGFTVSGESFADAYVVEAPEGPTYDESPGT